MTRTVSLSTLVSEDELKSLHAGQSVSISGRLLTARDAAHKRFLDCLNRDEPLPVDLSGHIIYYVGPTPARPGEPIGSAGPTTSARMNDYAPALLKSGLKGMIGKGEMSAEVEQALQQYTAVYFVSVGGAAALIAKAVQKSRIIAYKDLGPEAVRELTVKDFPAIVAQDCHGGNIFRQGRQKYQRQ